MLLPVILAGGTGSRLWPLSRELYPKQFLAVRGSHSMLQETIVRLSGIEHCAPILICNEEHRFIAAEQTRQLNVKHSGILLEPVGRNTAPAIALSAFQALKVSSDKNPILLVLAADHVIEDITSFESVVALGSKYAEQGKLVTFGIVPTSPETGYGYIKSLATSTEDNCRKIGCFVEKPDQKTAESYLESGDYFWNSGMFMFKASCYLAELKRYNPEIYDRCEKAFSNSSIDLDFIRIDKEEFELCPENSIDYAVMENTDNGVVIPMNSGWNDIGSWAALWGISEKDESGNVVQGDIISIDSSNNYLRADNKLIATVGVDNLIVVDTKDAILVADKNKVQDVKRIVNKLKANKRSEYKMHREVYRPWGKYDSVDHGPRDQVKRITVNPGEKLSTQMHYHRAEHWIVVSGTAKVINGKETFLVSEDQSTYIPLGTIHALENPGKIPLEMIEVQTGSYLDEDDVVRLQDSAIFMDLEVLSE